MDPRKKMLLKKTRPIWIGLLAWAVVSLVLFYLFNYSFHLSSQPFEKVEYKTSGVISWHKKDVLVVDTEHVNLEVGMANTIKELTYGLYGEGYQGQEVIANADEQSVHLSIANHDRNAPLTLRILIPEDRLAQLDITQRGGDLYIDKVRSQDFICKKAGGKTILSRIKARTLSVDAERTNALLHGAHVTKASILVDEGDLNLEKNQFRSIDTRVTKGVIAVDNPTITGVWKLLGEDGVYVYTHRTPWNISIDAHSNENNGVSMLYHSGVWKRASIASNTPDDYRGSVGLDPAHSLTAISSQGGVVITKRTRESHSPLTMRLTTPQ